MSDLSQWQIVLVDDEPDSLNLLADMLILNGAEVHTAPTGDACLALLDEFTPTATVVDLNMPAPDGWSILHEIRSRADLDGLPVIAVTAYYSDKVEDEAYRAGFDAFIRKPIKANEFVNVLRGLIG